MPLPFLSQQRTRRGEEAGSAWCLCEVGDLQTELTLRDVAKYPPTLLRHTCTARWTRVIQAKSAQSYSIWPTNTPYHFSCSGLNHILICVLNHYYFFKFKDFFRPYSQCDICKFTVFDVRAVKTFFKYYTFIFLSLSASCGQVGCRLHLLTVNFKFPSQLVSCWYQSCSTGSCETIAGLRCLIYEEVTRREQGWKVHSHVGQRKGCQCIDSGQNERNTSYPPSLSLCHILITLDSVSVVFRSSAVKVTVTFL